MLRIEEGETIDLKDKTRTKLRKLLGICSKGSWEGVILGRQQRI